MVLVGMPLDDPGARLPGSRQHTIFPFSSFRPYPPVSRVKSRESMQCNATDIQYRSSVKPAQSFTSSNGEVQGTAFFRQMQGGAQEANKTHSKTRVSRHRPQSHSLHQVTAVDTAGL